MYICNDVLGIIFEYLDEITLNNVRKISSEFNNIANKINKYYKQSVKGYFGDFDIFTEKDKYIIITDLQHMDVINNFNYKENIRELCFSDDYEKNYEWYDHIDYKINNLNNVTHVTFGTYFNHELKEGDLPPLLTHITFDKFFNHKLKEGVLPNTVTHLIFRDDYSQEIIKEILPKSLKYLDANISDDLKQYLIEKGVIIQNWDDEVYL